VIGADTSFLVSLAIREHPAHEMSWRLFEDEVLGRPGTLALAAQALAEFCHVVTDPRRFERPLDMTSALDVCEQWWSAEECRQVAVDEEAGTLFLGWMRDHRLGRKRLLDTLLAATYHLAGVRRIATTDWRDFARYGVFDFVPLGRSAAE
jgi:predicted nucleic acid-binding protein